MGKKIYTIGYEGLTIEAFIAALKEAGVQALLDIRAVPLSRKPGFSKNKLAGHLAPHGIRYYGLRGLGTPAAGRDAARKGRIPEMRRIFLSHMKTQSARHDLDKAITLATHTPSCLLCFEHDAGCCHRLIVAGKIAEETGMAIDHLNPASPLLL